MSDAALVSGERGEEGGGGPNITCGRQISPSHHHTSQHTLHDPLMLKQTLSAVYIVDIIYVSLDITVMYLGTVYNVRDNDHCLGCEMLSPAPVPADCAGPGSCQHPAPAPETRRGREPETERETETPPANNIQGLP